MRLLVALAVSMLPPSQSTAQEARFEWVAGATDGVEWREEFDGQTIAPPWTTSVRTDTQWWHLDRSALVIAGNRSPLWQRGNAGFWGRPVEAGRLQAATQLDYSRLGNGDVAGLALVRDEAHWLSVQVERIEPADLIAVRLRDGESSPWAGRLVATTALPSRFAAGVQLRIVGAAGTYTLSYAEPGGDWMTLARDVAAPALAPAAIGLFATDGAERPAH